MATCQGNDSREPKFEGGAWPLCPPRRLGVSVAPVLDPDAPSSRLVIEQLGKPTVKARLQQMARWSTGSDVNGEDLVADALIRVLDPEDAPWRPERITFLHHMNNVIRQTWDRQLRKILARQDAIDRGLARDENANDPELAPDEQLHELRTLHRWRKIRDEVLAEIGDKHPLTREICALPIAGSTSRPTRQRHSAASPTRSIALSKLCSTTRCGRPTNGTLPNSGEWRTFERAR